MGDQTSTGMTPKGGIQAALGDDEKGRRLITRQHCPSEPTKDAGGEVMREDPSTAWSEGSGWVATSQNIGGDAYGMRK